MYSILTSSSRSLNPRTLGKQFPLLCEPYLFSLLMILIQVISKARHVCAGVGGHVVGGGSGCADWGLYLSLRLGGLLQLGGEGLRDDYAHRGLYALQLTDSH